MTERERLQLFEAAGFDKIISQDFKTYLLANGFFRSPASTKYHGAYRGRAVRPFSDGDELSGRPVCERWSEMAESRKPLHRRYVP